MIPDNCRELVRNPKIKLADAGRNFTILNPTRLSISKIFFDGCVVKNKPAADFLLQNSTNLLIVELKGRDIEAGINQIIETTKFIRSNMDQGINIASLIVGRRYPRATPKIQKEKQKYFREFRFHLHIKTNSTPFEFCSAF